MYFSSSSKITERLRDPRGIRRAGLGQKGPRPIQSRQRGLVRSVSSVDHNTLEMFLILCCYVLSYVFL